MEHNSVLSLWGQSEERADLAEHWFICTLIIALSFSCMSLQLSTLNIFSLEAAINEIRIFMIKGNGPWWAVSQSSLGFIVYCLFESLFLFSDFRMHTKMNWLLTQNGPDLWLQMQAFDEVSPRQRRSSKGVNKPFRCQYLGCSSSFYDSTNLRKHERLKHGRKHKFRRGQSVLDSMLSGLNHPNAGSAGHGFTADGEIQPDGDHPNTLSDASLSSQWQDVKTWPSHVAHLNGAGELVLGCVLLLLSMGFLVLGLFWCSLWSSFSWYSGTVM